ncbi:hypothetical protein [Thiohalophilus sp.]|uniref:hypothetical protein n=1 Tax=Thiohalophilus sp. TaxID=3028392 RepID=UPI002ACDBB10|nr:hypothetical protein [Thiohalophilus sp.]MDZ7661505.1 hypothetical protein [Thiohalophilus sp.]
MTDLHCDPGFQQLLAQHFSITALEQQSGTVYGLWPDLTLAYMNPAWFRFARNNQGEPAISRQWQRGRAVTEALPDVLHPFYVELYLRSLEQEDDTPLEHDYECSSPAHYRLYTMTLHNLGCGAGLLIINSKRQVAQHRRIPQQADPRWYVDEWGSLVQCSHCRCYRNNQQKNHWDWILTWLTTPPDNLNHTLCPDCFNHYYSFTG